jgi:hypothetical protein
MVYKKKRNLSIAKLIMNRILAFILLVLLNESIYSQIDSLQLIEIEKKCQNTNYDILVQKYKNINQLVDTDEFEYLYYCKFKNKDFSYFDLNNDEKKFIQLYKSYKYHDVEDLGLKILANDPTDLKTLFQTSISLSKINKEDSAKLLMNRFTILESIIEKYGNGKTIETSYEITKIADEYTILEQTGHMFFNRKTKRTENELIDSWEIYNSSNKQFYFIHFRFFKKYWTKE